MKTSDVTRPWAMGLVAAAALLATTVAWLGWPQPPERAPGALALPHRELACASCHGEVPAAEACTGCHGAHDSTRKAHRRLAREGVLGCNRCHDVHGSDQGVRFGEVSARYAVGREQEIEPWASLHATVPLVAVERCLEGCHSLEGGDPIMRCVPEGGGEQALSVCFDEHRSGLDSQAGEEACAAQHLPRFAAWEAARTVAARVPVPPRQPSHAFYWPLAGLAGAAFGGLSWLGWGRWSRRRARHARALRSQAPRPAERRRLPVVDPSTCLGCYACVDACPYDVLRVERYVAIVEQPDACCGLTLCEQVCPNGSLTMTEGAAVTDLPRLTGDLEARDAPGLFLAGDVTGVPLIKTAILQGRLAADGASRHRTKDDGLDLVIVGAGPAGISAALRAKELGLRYRVIEQASVAQSIRSFPRGKLVFDQPLELPLTGKLWLERSTKEELLAKWLRLVRSERLVIDESRRFVGLERQHGKFVVEALDEGGAAQHYRAASVLMAIGTRGTPRKLALEVPDALADKVFYSLADARSFAGWRVLVVGLGDVAMESAIALAAQPGTEVTLAYRGEAMKRGKARNREQLERLVTSGRVRLLYRALLEGVEREQLELRVDGRLRTIPNDAVFVMIGNLLPRPLLEELGVGYGRPSPP